MSTPGAAPAPPLTKKKKAPPPVPPPAVISAHLILRGCLHAVAGAPLPTCRPSPLQNTWLKDRPLLTGRFGLDVGRGSGDGRGAVGAARRDIALDLGEDGACHVVRRPGDPEEPGGGDREDDVSSLTSPSVATHGGPDDVDGTNILLYAFKGMAQDLGQAQEPRTAVPAAVAPAAGATCAYLEAVQRMARRVVREDRAIVYWVCRRSAAEAEFGAGALYDDREVRDKSRRPDDMVVLAYVRDLLVCTLPGVPASAIPSLHRNTGRLQDVCLDAAPGKCTVSSAAGKKRRGGDKIAVRFYATQRANGDVAHAPPATPMPRPPTRKEVESLYEVMVRGEEGIGIVMRQKRLRAAREEAEAREARNRAQAAAAAAKEVAAPAQDEEMVVNVETVSGKIDYNKLVDQFGSKLITSDLMTRLENSTVRRGNVPFLHRFLRRNIFFSHRDMDRLLDVAEKNDGKGFYLYTGRGPSSSAMHMGHLVPFLMTQWLQQAFDVPLVIQMTDDEKFLFKGEYTDENGDNLDHFHGLALENAKDILACGFDKQKTFLFSDLDYVGRMYPTVVRIWKSVTASTVNGIFGFQGSANIGKMAFPAIQAAPSFPDAFPIVLGGKGDKKRKNMACLIPCAIDQDPYFRMTRDIAHRLVPKSHPLNGKPALFHSKFFPPLQGATGKMSSSDDSSAIFLTDSPAEIERKIKNNAFSGGRETAAEQRQKGADLEVDVSYQWLRFFLEDDDELAKIGADYGSGRGEFWSTGVVKARLIEILQEIVAGHQERRAKITDEEAREWMRERALTI